MKLENFWKMIESCLSEKALDVIKNCDEKQAQEFANCAAESINACAEEIDFMRDL